MRKDHPWGWGLNFPAKSDREWRKGVWRKAYQWTARRGLSDEPDSAEYRRLYRAWCKAGCPLPVAFIRQHANTPPTA